MDSILFVQTFASNDVYLINRTKQSRTYWSTDVQWGKLKSNNTIGVLATALQKDKDSFLHDSRAPGWSTKWERKQTRSCR